MATGKTVGRYTKLYIDGLDQSGSSAKWSVKADAKKTTVTALSSSTDEYLFGIPAISAKADLWFDNTVTTGAYTQLKGSYQARVVTFNIGIRAVPAAGDPALAAKFMAHIDAFPIDYAKAAAMTFDGDGVDPTLGAVFGTPFGVVLQPDGQLSVTTNGTTIDNGASSAGGAMGYLHVTAAGGTWAVIIQHDTASNMGTATTLITFTSNGTAIAGEAINASGTVNRYTRAVFTRTSGNFNGTVALVRG